jgi:hypothetical protein
VTTETDKIFQLIRIDPARHAPPVLAFLWGPQFPGGNIVVEQAGQRREAFLCVMESIRQKFTLFSPDGVPLRATLTVSLREYRDLGDQFAQIKPSSPDRTHVHVLQQGDTLAAVSRRFYDSPARWRPIADANRIEDPRRTAPGAFVRVPPLD